MPQVQVRDVAEVEFWQAGGLDGATWPADATPADANIELRLATAANCIVGVRAGRCAGPDYGELALSITNHSARRVVFGRGQLPHVFVTGWPSRDHSACYSSWGRLPPPGVGWHPDLTEVTVVGPGASVVLAVDLGTGWPDAGPPCESGWYSLVAVLPTVQPRTVGGACAREPYLPWEPDWRAVLPGASRASSGTGDNNREEVEGLSASDMGPNADPGGALEACREQVDAVLDGCWWPCGWSGAVVSDEVLVWVAADRGEAQ